MMTPRPLTANFPRSEDTTAIDWDEIYAAQIPKIFNYLRYRVGPDAAEDLAARVFEKAWARRSVYRRDLAGFGTWLFTIARNESIDHLRRRRLHQPFDDMLDRADLRTPEDDSIRTSDRQRLRRLLATLDERERELIALKFGAEMTNREIARQVGMSESNVGTVLHRTVQSLRRTWSKGDKR